MRADSTACTEYGTSSASTGDVSRYDPRVPRSEAEQMIDALRKGGKTFEEHIYAGEGHGFRTQANMIDSLRRAILWFDRHMGARA